MLLSPRIVSPKGILGKAKSTNYFQANKKIVNLSCQKSNSCTEPNRNFLTNAYQCRSSVSIRNYSQVFTPDNVLLSHYEDVQIKDCFLPEFVWENIHKFPNHTAMECSLTGRKYTYSQLRDKSRKFAASLVKLGLKPGAVISVIMPNVPEFAIIWYGIIEAGLIISPLNPLYNADEICHPLVNSDSNVIITFPDKLDTVKATAKIIENQNGKPYQLTIISFQEYDGVSRATPPGVLSLKEMIDNNIDTSIVDNIYSKNNITTSDTAVVVYSSGTTGLPKGVCLNHKSLVSNLTQIETKGILPHRQPEGNYQDVSTTVLPLFHIYAGFFGLLLSLRQGCKLVLLPKFDPKTYTRSIISNKNTLLFLVPPLVTFLTSQPDIKNEYLDRVRFVISSAAPIGQADIEKLLVKMPKESGFKQCYGLTETSPLVTTSKNKNEYFTSVGIPIPSTKLKVIDVETGKTVGVGETGEICIQGPQLMKGYLKNPKATAEMIDDNGWLHSGDIGHFNEAGYLFIDDRIKELIKVKGFQVAPAELEKLLRSHPKILDAAVIGVPDARSGEVPIGFITPYPNQTSPSAEEIKKYISEKVAKHKQLADVVFIDSIPKNPSGKILRRKLKADFLKK